MRQVVVILLLLVAGALVAAPAPRARQKRDDTQVTAGEWTYTWADHTNNMTLHKEGFYESIWIGTKFTGYWEWDPEKRILTIWEKLGKVGWTLPRDDLKQYKFVLDREFKVEWNSQPNTGYMKSMKRGKYTPPKDNGPKLKF